MTHKLIAGFSAVMAFLMQQVPAVAQTESSSAPAADDGQFVVLTAYANELRAAINRTDFDLQALLDSLDYDDQRIIEFVRDTIAFEPYRGVLRGAAGTLMSKAGNSLDQSLLLASLLQDAGYSARIAGGTLRDDQIAALLAQIYTHVEPDVAETDSSRLTGITNRYTRSRIFPRRDWKKRESASPRWGQVNMLFMNPEPSRYRNGSAHCSRVAE